MTTAFSKTRWVRVVVAIATFGLIALFARSVDWRDAWQTLSNANPLFVSIAVATNLATVIVKAIRWRMFLASIGAPSATLAVRATFAGAALNNVVFANGGDAARVAAVASHSRASSAAVLGTLAIDKLCDLASYALIFVTVAFVLPLPTELARWRRPILAALAAALVAGVILWRARKPIAPGTSDDAAGSLLERARKYVRRIGTTMSDVSTPARLSGALALAVIAWSCQWATFHFAALAAHLPATPAVSLIALLTVNASFLIRLTPGNVGVFQLLYTLATTSAGLDRDGAVAVALLISFIQYIPVTVIGLTLASSLMPRGEPRNDIVTTRTGGNRERAT